MRRDRQTTCARWQSRQTIRSHRAATLAAYLVGPSEPRCPPERGVGRPPHIWSCRQHPTLPPPQTLHRAVPFLLAHGGHTTCHHDRRFCAPRLHAAHCRQLRIQLDSPCHHELCAIRLLLRAPLAPQDLQHVLPMRGIPSHGPSRSRLLNTCKICSGDGRTHSCPVVSMRLACHRPAARRGKKWPWEQSHRHSKGYGVPLCRNNAVIRRKHQVQQCMFGQMSGRGQLCLQRTRCSPAGGRCTI